MWDVKGVGRRHVLTDEDGMDITSTEACDVQKRKYGPDARASRDCPEFIGTMPDLSLAEKDWKKKMKPEVCDHCKKNCPKTPETNSIGQTMEDIKNGDTTAYRPWEKKKWYIEAKRERELEELKELKRHGRRQG